MGLWQLSYSRPAAEKAGELHSALTEASFQAWIDTEDLRPGQD